MTKHTYDEVARDWHLWQNYASRETEDFKFMSEWNEGDFNECSTPEKVKMLKMAAFGAVKANKQSPILELIPDSKNTPSRSKSNFQQYFGKETQEGGLFEGCRVISFDGPEIDEIISDHVTLSADIINDTKESEK